MPPQTTKSLRHGQATSLFSPQRGFPLPPSVGQPGRTNVGHIPIITDACNQRGSKSSAVRQRVTCHEVDQKKKERKRNEKEPVQLPKRKNKEKETWWSAERITHAQVLQSLPTDGCREQKKRLLSVVAVAVDVCLEVPAFVEACGGAGRGRQRRSGEDRQTQNTKQNFSALQKLQL